MLSDTFDSKRYPRISKLEQTIMANRGMDIHLNRSLRVIEVDRRRMLKMLARKQRQVRADLKVKKDEKFHLMLRHQMQKMSNEEPERVKKIPINPIAERSAEDIESALFTNGLVNAPGVNHRMKRLATRTRILPEFDDDEDEGEQPDTCKDDDRVSSEPDSPPPQLEAPSFPRERTLPILVGDIAGLTPRSRNSSLPSPVEGIGKIATANPAPAVAGKGSDQALVWMTSGICSVINNDAEIKNINYESDMSEKLAQANLTPAAPKMANITTFSLLAKPRSTKPLTHLPRLELTPETRSRDRSSAKPPPRNANPLHRCSTASDAIFSGRLNPPNRRSRGDVRHSRLSIVKTQIDTNEKEYLMKLRKQSQKLENEDVSKRVWEFIGRRPVSMYRDRSTLARSYADGDDVEIGDDDDTLSTEEEEQNRLRFLASANVTARHAN